jgi:hypothetical protein
MTAAKPKVLFISTWINHPECIPVQRDLIKKFCKEDTDFLAVLDGKTEECFTNNCNKNIIVIKKIKILI